MESSIAVFLWRWSACELPPTIVTKKLVGFEPTRVALVDLTVHPLNHSAKEAEPLQEVKGQRPSKAETVGTNCRQFVALSNFL